MLFTSLHPVTERSALHRALLLTCGLGLSAGCGASSAANTTQAASNGNSTVTTSSSQTCDESVQPACPATTPSYKNQIAAIIVANCSQCHDPNGIGSAVATGGAMGAGGPTHDPNFINDPNRVTNPNDLDRYDPSDAHDWSKYANIANNVTLIEQQVFLCNMPPAGTPGISASDRTLLLQWLACHAPNN